MAKPYILLQLRMKSATDLERQAADKIEKLMAQLSDLQTCVRSFCDNRKEDGEPSTFLENALAVSEHDG